MVEDYDLILRNARLRGVEGLHDIGVRGGRIESIVKGGLRGRGEVEVDACGRLVLPAFFNMHFHLDSVLTLGNPRLNESGTLWEGIEIWGELKKSITEEDILRRVEEFIKWSVINGVLYIRTHADCTEPSLTCVKALIKAREEFKDLIDIQVTAFPQDGILTEEGNAELLRKAVELGADNVGMIPHNEHTREEGVKSVEIAFDIAEEFDRGVDGHVDETDDPCSRYLEVVAKQAIKRGWVGRVSAGHVTASHSWDPAYRFRLMPLIRRAGITIVPNPLINANLQGRFDSYPKRRGLAPIKEFLRAGVNVALGHDCVLDPWYPLGTGNMLHALFMAIHLDQLTGWDELMGSIDLITVNAAKAWVKGGLKDYGVCEGCMANLLVMNAKHVLDVLRNLEPPLYVIREGRLVADNSGPGREYKVFFKGRWVRVELSVEFLGINH